MHKVVLYTTGVRPVEFNKFAGKFEAVGQYGYTLSDGFHETEMQAWAAVEKYISKHPAKDEAHGKPALKEV